MNKPEECLSQSKYAEHRNITKGYIGRLVKEGRLHLIKEKLNVLMSDAELDNKSNDDKAPNYWSEKALHEKANRANQRYCLPPLPDSELQTMLTSAIERWTPAEAQQTGVARPLSFYHNHKYRS